jgi:hypothetical protein
MTKDEVINKQIIIEEFDQALNVLVVAFAMYTREEATQEQVAVAYLAVRRQFHSAIEALDQVTDVAIDLARQVEEREKQEETPGPCQS